MARQVPKTLRISVWMLWGLVLLSGLAALLVGVYRDEVEIAWAHGNEAALEQFQQGGLEQLRASSIDIPDFGPVAWTAFFTFALVALVLSAFLRGGHPWARWGVSLLVVFAGFMSALTMTWRIPDLFIALAVVSVVLCLGLLVFVWHPSSSHFFALQEADRDAEDAAEDPATGLGGSDAARGSDRRSDPGSDPGPTGGPVGR